MYGTRYTHVALLMFMMHDILLKNNGKSYKNECSVPQSKDIPPKISITTNVNGRMILCNINLVTQLSYLAYFLAHTLLLLAGDVHENPGPSNTRSNEMSIIHVNAGSIRYKIDKLYVEAANHDIITVSETWLTDTIDNKSVAMPGFNPPIRQDRNGYGGVAIYVKSNLVCKPRPDLDVPGLEAVWIETKLDQNTLLVCSMYRPPGSLVDYWKLIEESVKNAYNTPHRFVILGDFNNCYLNNQSPHLLGIIQQYNLVQHVREFTRITETTSSCIDLILSSSSNFINSVSVLPPLCSEHSVPCVKLKSEQSKPQYYKKTIMNYSKLNIEQFRHELSQTNFEDILSQNSIDESARIFSEQIMDKAKTCMPVKTVKVRENSPPWLNNHILIMREEKNRIHSTATRLKTPEAWKRFREFRNYYNEELKKSKENYIKQLDDQVSNKQSFNTKQWWKLVNDFMKNKGINNEDIPPIESDNNVIYNNKEKADCFNSYFHDQSKVVGNDDPLPNIPIRDSIVPPLILSSDEVASVILNLNTTKAVGPDQIHNKLIIEACPVIVDPLTLLFNRSLTEGKFPLIWKTAHITPIHKKESRSKCSNYRPISLLSCVGKILEKCVKNI